MRIRPDRPACQKMGFSHLKGEEGAQLGQEGPLLAADETRYRSPGRFSRASVRATCLGSRHYRPHLPPRVISAGFSRRPKPGILKATTGACGSTASRQFLRLSWLFANPVADLTPALIFRCRGCEGGPFCRTVPALPSACRGLPNLGSGTTDRRRRSRSLRGPDVTARRSRPARRRN